jgi:predicted cation transporter
MLVLVMACAWIGQGLVLAAIGEPLIANEIELSNAWYFWLVATAGPIQPLAGVIGGSIALLGLRARSPRP